MKKCPICKEKFSPSYSSLQKCCSPKCAILLVKKKKKEVVDENIKEMSIRVREKDREKNLQDEINILARKIDIKFGFSCIDCGSPFKGQRDAAHFHSRGSHPSIRYNLHNLHTARSYCNKYSDKHKTGYIEGLINRYGQDYYDMVESLPLTYPTTQLRDVSEKLKIVRKLNRDFDTLVFNSGDSARESLNEIIGIY